MNNNKPFLKLNKGINKRNITLISKYKKEPKWMLKLRLKAFNFFKKLKNPNFGPDLNNLDFNEYNYFIKQLENKTNSWEDIPENIKQTFNELGIIKAEQEYLAGITTQFESEAIYSKNKKELEEKGIIFLDTDTALKRYPNLFKEYFAKIVKINDNKYASLNSAVWSGGSFVYVPDNVKLDKPIQSYFRMNSESFGQFERTLIIVGKNSEIDYVEGCTAPRYDANSLHAAVVEIHLKENAKLRYTTIQNWSNNVVNLVTKRASVSRNGFMQWVDGNIGSRINMKYPCSILKDENAKSEVISIAVGDEFQFQDTGAKMIHLAKNTSSNIISKSICKNGATVNYRGKVFISKSAINSKSHIECDSLILDNISKSDTIPNNRVLNKKSFLEHEASISKINEEQLFYLMSRGINKDEAINLIMLGFIEPFSKLLPMEYAVELNKLIKMRIK